MRKAIIFSLVLFVAGANRSVKAGFIFGTPTNLGPVVNSIDSDGSPDISADGLTLYFDSIRPGGLGGWDIWMATRSSTESDGETPVALPAPVNSWSNDSGPSISTDGLSLYFASDRSGGYGSYDLYVARRETTDDPWDVLENLGSIVNDWGYDNHPSISADGLMLFFGSSRDGNYDLYITQRATIKGEWTTPVSLGSMTNTSYYELSPDISSDGLSLFFDRRNAGGDRDIWVAARDPRSDVPTSSMILEAPVNTGYQDTDPSISADGRTLYFGSTRAGGVGGQDIWQVSVAPVWAVPDFNGDGIVDLFDFCELANNWLKDDRFIDIAPAPYGDGIVDYKDLSGLFGYWLIQPSLVAYWKLDETEGIVAHDSVDGCHGTLHDGPVWQSAGGQIGGALRFDGIDDYVSTGFVLNPADGPFSVFALVKGGRPGQAIISQADGTGTGRSWLCMDISDGKLMTELKSGNRYGYPIISSSVVTDGAWHYIGLTWDGSQRRLYVDGKKVGEDSAPSSELESADGGLYLGATKTRIAGTFYSGLIDEVRIYDRAVMP